MAYTAQPLDSGVSVMVITMLRPDTAWLKPLEKVLMERSPYCEPPRLWPWGQDWPTFLPSSVTLKQLMPFACWSMSMLLSVTGVL